MDPERKRVMFDLLVGMGYKEIEVGFPSAWQTDFDFVRSLIEEGAIPDDVTIQVLTQAREHLIDRTYESIDGAKQAIVHLYNSTAIVQREVVFRTDMQGVVDIALAGARLCKAAEATLQPDTTVFYEYSPESYTGTELEFALEICNGVLEVFEPTPERKVIINLPATVEMATPNVYADSIEWMSRHLAHREDVHPLAAPAQRPRHRRRRRRARLHGRRRPHRGLPVRQRGAHGQRRPGRPRHEPVHAGHRPGDRLLGPRPDQAHGRVLQPAARAGAAALGGRPRLHGVQRLPPGRHQEGLRRHGGQGRRGGQSVDEIEWAVPYLPVDPKDIGRSYEAVIRVNSQSGKGGVAYLLKADHSIDLPRRLQIEFSGVVQQRTDAEGGEVTERDLGSSATSTCRPTTSRQVGPVRDHLDGDVERHRRHDSLSVEMRVGDGSVSAEAVGTGPIAAFLTSCGSRASRSRSTTTRSTPERLR